MKRFAIACVSFLAALYVLARRRRFQASDLSLTNEQRLRVLEDYYKDRARQFSV